MNVLILGATRGVGRQLLAQALDAGHSVTAFARSAATIPAQPRLTLVPAASRMMRRGSPRRCAART